MRGIGTLILLALGAALAACGGTNSPAFGARTPGLRWVLTSDAERLEFEPQPLLADLFNEAVRSSRPEGANAKSTSPFLIIQNGDSAVAPSFDPRTDLLQTPDAGQPVQLTFGDRGEGRWPESRRAALGGLSEREAAEQVARSLLWLWGIQTNSVLVVRAPNAPFAAAYTDDGTLRLNPALLYMAAAASGISSHASENQ